MRSFGDLEARLMRVFWEADEPLTVHRVIEMLDPVVAYTTAITVIERLRDKGWLEREKVGRSFRYTPTRNESEYAAKLMADALGEAGDRTGALLAFAGQLDSDELERLRAVLERVDDSGHS